MIKRLKGRESTLLPAACLSKGGRELYEVLYGNSNELMIKFVPVGIQFGVVACTAGGFCLMVKLCNLSAGERNSPSG